MGNNEKRDAGRGVREGIAADGAMNIWGTSRLTPKPCAQAHCIGLASEGPYLSLITPHVLLFQSFSETCPENSYFLIKLLDLFMIYLYNSYIVHYVTKQAKIPPES